MLQAKFFIKFNATRRRISAQSLSESLLIACSNLDEESVLMLLNAGADIHYQRV